MYSCTHLRLTGLDEISAKLLKRILSTNFGYTSEGKQKLRELELLCQCTKLKQPCIMLTESVVMGAKQVFGLTQDNSYRILSCEHREKPQVLGLDPDKTYANMFLLYHLDEEGMRYLNKSKVSD
jgi:hypothetical protein